MLTDQEQGGGAENPMRRVTGTSKFRQGRRKDQHSTDRPRTIKSKRRGCRAKTGRSRPRQGGRAQAQAKADRRTGTQHREQIAPLQLKQRSRPLVGEIPIKEGARSCS